MFKKIQLTPLICFFAYGLLFLLTACAHNDTSFLRGSRYEAGGVFIGASPSISSDGAMIVFGSPRYGKGDVCRINSNGTEWTRLTFSEEYEGEPAFSADGKKIVFVSEKFGNGEICTINTDGSNEVRLTGNQAYDSSPAFSPDGLKIAFVRNEVDINCGLEEPQIFMMNSDGSDERKIIYDDSWAADPSFSPDGTMLAYSTGDGENRWINLLDIKSSKKIAVIKKPGHCDEPSFSHDGKSVVFVADWDTANWEYEIYSFDIKENSSRRVTYMKGIDKQNPSYMKNGEEIMFFSLTDEKGGEIIVVNNYGAQLRKIAKTY